MSTYIITTSIKGTFDVYVDAETEEEAREKLESNDYDDAFMRDEDFGEVISIRKQE
jgi:DNA-dependent RNA polymerase auxiliary subunit epsilon